MRTLYVKSGCQFCASVLLKIAELGVDVSEKNIADEGVLDELLAKGGKQQTPFFIDDEKGIAMYESDAINEYLVKEYDTTNDDWLSAAVIPTQSAVRVHRSPGISVCEACEG